MMVAEPSVIKTKKSVSQTLADLRQLFSRYDIEDWEPVPAEQGPGYLVRYFRNRVWTEIGSFYQPNKALNLRVCHQVIDNLMRWEQRGVTGLVKVRGQGQSFMGGDLVATGDTVKNESFDEACAILGIDPQATTEEIKRIYQVKVQYAHPDKGGDADRFKRLQKAYETVMRVKQPKEKGE